MHAVSARLFYHIGSDSVFCRLTFMRPDGTEFPALFLLEIDLAEDETSFLADMYLLGEENGESVWLPATAAELDELWPKAAPLLDLIGEEFIGFSNSPEGYGLFEPEEFDANGNPVSYLIAQVYAQ
ncbi:MAG: hypothetical protein K0041_08765 [Acidithiobacillus sp.]|nr:hypothetical protein [Acidithiobacillus sp.]